jgi:hypothetical protein
METVILIIPRKSQVVFSRPLFNLYLHVSIPHQSRCKQFAVMAPSAKLTALLLCVGHAYASYFGGIGIGPFIDSSDNAYCPPGTLVEQTAAFCSPTGTQQDML